MIAHISDWQFGVFVKRRGVSLDDCRTLNSTTLRSLIRRGFLERRGDRVVANSTGIDAWFLYGGAGPIYRERTRPLSESVRERLPQNMAF
jgi:hypothetical protein